MRRSSFKIMPKKAKAKLSNAKRFVLVREEDVSGTSGTGVVAEGIQWSNGTCSMHWMSQFDTKEDLGSIAAVEEIHGHGGKTKIVWVDK